jgi:hypothetical protein
MPRLQVQVPIEIVQNIWIDICPFVAIEFSAIDVNSRCGKLLKSAKETNRITFTRNFIIIRIQPVH